jgi:NAD(P)H-hydrate epimerase
MSRPGLPISPSADVRQMDEALIHGVGIPSAVLVEAAAHGTADALVAWWGARPPPSTLILCGPGNNGADGYALARHLHLRGWPVRAEAVLPPRSEDCVTTHRVAEALGLLAPAGPPTLVVDAIFGTGQRAPLTLPPLPARALPWVALDVATGVDADTGARLADVPAPVHAFVIGRLKPWCFATATPWSLVDIGLEWRPVPPVAVLVDQRPWLPPLPQDANKWRRGHVAVRAGSAEKAGAAMLACLGALHGGAGLVTLVIEREAWSRLGALPPEVMVAEPGAPGRFDAWVLGPGLGRAADAELRAHWSEVSTASVFDADALRALDGTPSAHPRLLTPHAGEAAALLGVPWREVEADRLAALAGLAPLGAVILKGACPLVTGAPPGFLPGGNPALGAGGSGDVLAGLCGALLANVAAGGAAPLARDQLDAVALAAAWLHQEAARGLPVGATASELAGRVPAARAHPAA